MVRHITPDLSVVPIGDWKFKDQLGDIERLMSVRQVIEDTAADYRFRAFLDRNEVADRIAEHVRAINYGGIKGGFKSAVTDKRRAGAYFDVWGRMDDLQWELSGEQQIARSKT